jgi:cytochrome c oxidase subunit II
MTRRLCAFLSLFAITACSGALDPSGPGAGARRIADLWWVMFWLGLIPIVVVTVLVVLIARNRERGPFLTERRMIVQGGVVLSVLLLIPVVVMTTLVERDLRQGHGGDLAIDLIGHQFWWEVVYPGPDGVGEVRTANEIHIPVGVPVVLRVTSHDVIHSLWVPEIQGKIDMIPGRVNETTFLAEEPGVYRGQCAEFCGLGHGVMRLLVIALPPEEFEEWLEAESQPVSIEVPSETMRIFANSCAPCHTVRGLFDDPTFEGDFGPDLTHLASRRMIGANILPNTREALARWIVDPQGVKPGNLMPNVGLGADDLNAILDLLEELE